MKRIVIWVISVVLMLALAAPALANAKYMYVTKDNLKVYAKPSTGSKVLDTLDLGEKIGFLDKSSDGNWYGYLLDGDTMGWVQKKYLSADKVCDHEWGKWEITKKATCTKKGSRTRECKLCGLEQTEDIPKAEHTFGKWKITREATCKREGRKVRTCKVCDYEESTTIPKDKHTYGKWTVTREATCQREGRKVRTCKVCGNEETKTIEKAPHSYGGWTITVRATDHASGIRSKVCKVCGAKETQSYDPAGTLRRGARGDDVREVQELLAEQNYLNDGGVDGVFGAGMERAVMQFQRDQGLNPDGVVWPQTKKRLVHDFGDWVTTLPLTRYSDGERTRTCKDCGYQQRESIPMAPTLKRGERGEEVRTVQTMLSEVYYNAGQADGIYGGKLDSAFQAFAKAHGLSFIPGQVRPVDIDALANEWIAKVPQTKWKGKGDKSAPVQLTLSISPAWDSATDPGDILTFRWNLIELGSQSCKYKMILFGYGENHTFASNNLVAAIDGVDLLANGGNRISGTITIPASNGTQVAGERTVLRFCAVGTSNVDGAHWLSNTVVWRGKAKG